MYNAVRAQIEKRGARIVRSLVGNYVTSLDMAGCSVTVSMFNDAHLAFWDAPGGDPCPSMGR
jgi:dihydroxyacetone kinase-like protein